MTSVAFLVSNARSVYISEENKHTWLEWAIGNSLGIDNEVLVGLTCLVAHSVMLSLTQFGRLVRAQLVRKKELLLLRGLT